jgi:glutamate 5-kinase
MYLFKGVVVDDGAIRAIKGGASLLPVGVLQVTGDFPAGASIALLTRLGGKFGEGVTNYSAAEIDRIKGRQSAEISQLIDEYRGDEVVSHRKITLIGSRLFLGQQLGSVGRGEAAGVVVGEGAIQAIKRGASLLPVGVLETVGTFRRGEAIAIMNRNGKRVATGVTSYSSDAVERIKGRHSSEIKPTLGLLRYNGDSVIPHRKLTLE